MNLVWIWLLVALAGHVFAGLCPGSSLHCSCSGGLSDLHVFCHRTSSVDMLKENLKSFRGLRITRLEISQIDDLLIPYDIFQGLRVETLLMSNCKFVRFETVSGRNPFFSLSNSLRHLILKDNDIGVSPQLLLDDMEQLESFDIIGVSIRSVDNNWFLYGPPKLRFLTLTRANITSLGSAAFKYLEHLTHLNLASNSISSKISYRMFPPSLIHLNLRNNKLQEIEKDFFDHLPNLYLMDFSRNFLQHFPYDSFTRNQEVKALLFENPLVCDTRLCLLVKTHSYFRLEGRCAAPEDLKGKLLQHLEASLVCQDKDLLDSQKLLF